LDWVPIGTDTLRAARKAKGYSYEAMGRLLSVSSKTYERYEKTGRVRRDMLDLVAEVLGLEVERLPAAKVTVSEPGESGAAELAEMRLALAELAELKETVARIEKLLLALSGSPHEPEGSPRVVTALHAS